MNKDTFAGNWKIFKGEVRKQWGKLTDDEVDQIAGDREKLLGQIQKSYGIIKDEAEKEVKAWESAFRKNVA